MLSRSRSVQARLSKIIAAAIASTLPACGGTTAGSTAADAGEAVQDATADAGSGDAAGTTGAADAANAADSLADGAPADAPFDASLDASSCGSVPGAVLGSSASGDAGADAAAAVLWTTTYEVVATCCEPQLSSVLAWGTGAGPTAGDECNFSVEVPCGASTLPVDASPACESWCQSAAPAGVTGALWCCQVQPGDGGSGAIATCNPGCGSGCGLGRAPRGFRPRRVAAGSAVGERLAWMAQLEAASVDAFRALHADLERLRAPRALLDAANDAARDEERHARMVSGAASRHGARVPPASVAPIAPRSLEELAIANAEEGCVRETFGAALVAAQAKRATEPGVRAMLRAIADDELRHAALSWQVAEWLGTRLDARGRRNVDAAREAAFAALEAELGQPLAQDDALGAPAGAQQLRLLSALRAGLAA